MWTSPALPPGTICSPLDLKVQFVRLVWAGRATAAGTATVAHRGRSYATAHADIADPDGKPVALATSSLVIIEGQSWGTLALADDTPWRPTPSR